MIEPELELVPLPGTSNESSREVEGESKKTGKKRKIEENVEIPNGKPQNIIMILIYFNKFCST